MNAVLSTPPGAMATIRIPAQSVAVQPEKFQSDLIGGMSRALLRQPSPPCLLRAPTGSGKTFVVSQVLERVSAQRPVLWFWFVPFVTLVQQTADALAANAPSLSPRSLNDGRNQEAHAGMVLLSTAQGVARAQWRTKGYDADGDDATRTLAAFVARARAQGLQVGLVVDEAHIGVDKNTEFGKFAHWLRADYLLMATATPKDERLNEFLTHAGYSAQEAFAVSRDAAETELLGNAVDRPGEPREAVGQGAVEVEDDRVEDAESGAHFHRVMKEKHATIRPSPIATFQSPSDCMKGIMLPARL